MVLNPDVEMKNQKSRMSKSDIGPVPTIAEGLRPAHRLPFPGAAGQARLGCGSGSR
jgi:hypothetical protein